MIDRFERWHRRLRASVDRHRWVAGARSDDTGNGDSARPGLLMVQIDGLGIEMLRRAEVRGVMPNLRRLRAAEPYRLAPVYSGVPSSTPSFQAELFYGQRHVVPGYRFVHRPTGRVFRMSDRESAATVEAGLDGRGLLGGGSSYSNIYRGGAQVTRFSMAALGWGDFFRASRPRHLPRVVLGHSFDVVRAAAISLGELAVGLPQLVRAVRHGQPLGEELRFLQARVAVNVVLREAVVTLAVIDMARGLPVIHLDLLGYDEWAHRRGPGSRDALRALRGIDRVIGRLTRAARRAHLRHYDLWVLSDHGQERTVPFEEEFGRPTTEALGRILDDHGIPHDLDRVAPEGEQGQRATMLGARAAELLVPGLELTPRWRDPARATAALSGPLGHLYLPSSLDPADIRALAADLVDRGDVPLVCGRGDDGTTWARTAHGDHLVPDDAVALLGDRHPFREEAAADLAAVSQHPDAGDLVLWGWRPDAVPISFDHENGSHGGPGPDETSAFVWAPVDTPLEWDRSAHLRAGDLRTAALRVLEGESRRPAARWDRTPDGATLRLVTYNVHSCVGLDGKLSPERIARVIARIEPDVVALQEVDVGRGRTGGIDQAELIAEHLGMLVHFHPTYEVAEERFGDAVLSRLPMRVVRTGPLPRLAGRNDLEPRGAIWVEVDAGDVVYTIVNTHLSIHPRERRLQAEALLGPGWLGDIAPGTDLVLCGDFNAGPGFPTCRAIGERLVDVQVGLDGHRPRRTWGGRWPVARIDHVFVDPRLDVLHVDVPSTHLTRTASDHLPLVADIRPHRLL